MCKVLKVSRCAYYKDQSKPKKKQELKLLVIARSIHRKSKTSYGSRRMMKALRKEGFKIGRYRTRTLMKKMGFDVV